MEPAELVAHHSYILSNQMAARNLTLVFTELCNSWEHAKATGISGLQHVRQIASETSAGGPIAE